MANKVEELFEEAMMLSKDERDRLREMLEATAGGDFASPEIEQVWIEEAKRIDREVDDGRMELIPADVVLRELREIVSK